MAHWIIKDKGLQGMFYICSNCGAVYWDILDKIDYDFCLACKSSMEEDGEEYYKDLNGDWRR